MKVIYYEDNDADVRKQAEQGDLKNRESNWNYSGKNGYITKTGKGSNSLVKHLTSKKQ